MELIIKNENNLLNCQSVNFSYQLIKKIDTFFYHIKFSSIIYLSKKK